METKELLDIYKSLFETWRFQVNSHWQRSSFFAAFETVALAACWKLVADKPNAQTAPFGVVLAFLGIALTVVWYLINNRTHEYSLYWLRAVGELETKLMKGSREWGLDYAKKILDVQRSKVMQRQLNHHRLEKAVPSLFFIAWIILFLFGIDQILETGRVSMNTVVSYESVSLSIAIASLLASIAAILIARSSLSQAKRVADRDQEDWRQRKWYDLYFKADEAYDALDRFQVSYPSTSSPGWDTTEMQREYNDLMRIMRTVNRIALVFPKNPMIDSLFEATAAFKNKNEATSKNRLTKILDAVEGIRQKALVVDVNILD